MKVSILIAVLILVVGGLLGFQSKARLEMARKLHVQVVEEAEALGLSVEVGEEEHEIRAKLAERDLTRREDEARAIAVEVIAFAKKMKEFEESGEEPDQAQQMEMMVMMQKFIEMDVTQLKVMIAVLKESDEIDDEMREGIVGFSIMMLGSEHPEAALALFTESSELIDMDGMGDYAVSSALTKWASTDPMGALDWIRENQEKHPDLVDDDAKRAVVAGAAQQDPALAFSLIAELKLEESSAVSGIVESARSSEQRAALLESVRKNMEDGSEKSVELRNQVLSGLASNITREGFDSAAEWMEEAKLSDEEQTAFINGLSMWGVGEDAGKWLDWMDGKLSGNELESKVDNLVQHWTRQDFKAAGTWLNDAEEGPVKTAAVASYAQTVAPYEPEAAAQWALTLPKGDERDDLVRQIHQEWKQKDPAAAKVFGEAQGLVGEDEGE